MKNVVACGEIDYNLRVSVQLVGSVYFCHTFLLQDADQRFTGGHVLGGHALFYVDHLVS